MCRSRLSPVEIPTRLNQQFAVSAKNRVWTADSTFVPTRTGWLYVAVVLDLYSRRIVTRLLSQERTGEDTNRHFFRSSWPIDWHMEFCPWSRQALVEFLAEELFSGLLWVAVQSGMFAPAVGTFGWIESIGHNFDRRQPKHQHRSAPRYPEYFLQPS